MLGDARNSYEEFCIPICVLPATISNDIPGSNISIGSDTGLNVVVEVRDLLLRFSFCFVYPKPTYQSVQTLSLKTLTVTSLTLIRNRKRYPFMVFKE